MRAEAKPVVVVGRRKAGQKGQVIGKACLSPGDVTHTCLFWVRRCLFTSLSSLDYCGRQMCLHELEGLDIRRYGIN